MKNIRNLTFSVIKTMVVDVVPVESTVATSSGSTTPPSSEDEEIPENALLNSDGSPILNSDGSYILLS
jgi:hypothetical protein